jgi:hypothetical protein
VLLAAEGRSTRSIAAEVGVQPLGRALSRRRTLPQWGPAATILKHRHVSFDQQRQWLGQTAPMSKKLSAAAASVASGKVPAPVRVRLKRLNCNEANPYPTDQQAREWWHRLKNASGTTSSAPLRELFKSALRSAREHG